MAESIHQIHSEYPDATVGISVRDPGSGLAFGKNASVGWLVERMITVSSNLATNILIDLVNAESVQATIERLGARTMHGDVSGIAPQNITSNVF